MDLEERLGKLFRRIRLDKDLTQKELADKIELTQAQWSAYEKSKNAPSAVRMILICKKLGINPVKFFEVLLDEKNSLNSPVIHLLV